METIRLTPHSVSPHARRQPDGRISVRVGDTLRSKLAMVAKKTRHGESDLVRAALMTFFASRTSKEITRAVIEARTTLTR
jgi:hypothetical protein